MDVLKQRTALLTIAVLVFSASLLTTAGCKGNDTAPAAANSAAVGKRPVGETRTEQPTAWQEAAKQKAIQDGPAIEAALKAQQEGRPVQPGK